MKLSDISIKRPVLASMLTGGRRWGSLLLAYVPLSRTAAEATTLRATTEMVEATRLPLEQQTTAFARFGDRFDAEGKNLVEIKRSGRVVGIDLHFLLQQNGARVDALVHPEQRETGDRFAFDQRPVDRAGATVPRQKRGMETDGTETRNAEHPGRHDLRDESEDRQIGVQRSKFFVDFGPLERLILAHGNIQLKGPLFQRVEFAAGVVGRAVDSSDIVTEGNELVEGALRKGRLADQDDSHNVVAFQSARFNRSLYNRPRGNCGID